MRSRKTKNVSMTPELERFVADKVASGRYRSASEVVRAALRLLEKHEPLEAKFKSGSARIPEMLDGT
jgi:antitoxin ParD1/3/4